MVTCKIKHLQKCYKNVLAFYFTCNHGLTLAFTHVYYHYLRRRLASEGILTLGVTLSRCVCVRRISLGGEGNALYSVFCSYFLRKTRFKIYFKS